MSFGHLSLLMKKKGRNKLSEQLGDILLLSGERAIKDQVRDSVQSSMFHKKRKSLTKLMFFDFPFKGEGGRTKLDNDFLFLDIELCTWSLSISLNSGSYLMYQISGSQKTYT